MNIAIQHLDGPREAELRAAELRAAELRVLRRHFNPARERLWSKMAELTQDLACTRPPAGPLAEVKDRALENLARARACFDRWWGHPLLGWRYLHRADEDLVLLAPLERIGAVAVDVLTAFDLNVSEPGVRRTWLGGEGADKGALPRAVERLAAGDALGPGEEERARQLVRAALRRVNDKVDQEFWKLSNNLLMSVYSGVLLALTMVAFGALWEHAGPDLFGAWSGSADAGAPVAGALALVLLGMAGAFVSNLLTRQDFLFVEGGPYWRYFLHPLLSKAVLAGFAAPFVCGVARSGLVLELGRAPAGAAEGARGLVTLGLADAQVRWALAVLAVVSGFAADKLLRDLIDRVLKRLEQGADKSVKTPAQGA